MKQLILSMITAAGASLAAQAVNASDIPVPEEPVALIELIEIPATDVEPFIADWNERAKGIGRKPGCITAMLYRSLLSGARYQLIQITQWQSYNAWSAANESDTAVKPKGGVYRPVAWSNNVYAETFQSGGVPTGAHSGATLQRAKRDPQIKFPEQPFVFINLMEMSAEDIAPFVSDWQVRSKIMGQMPAAMGATLYRSVQPDNTFQIINVSQWQSYNGFIDANNTPAYAEKLTADLNHTASIKLTRGFYRPVASYTQTCNAAPPKKKE